MTTTSTTEYRVVNEIGRVDEAGPFWPPKEFQGVKWLPERPLPWSWLAGPVILFLTGTILLALALSLPAMAEAAP